MLRWATWHYECSTTCTVHGTGPWQISSCQSAHTVYLFAFKSSSKSFIRLDLTMSAANDAVKTSSLPYVDNDGITPFEKVMDVVLGVSFRHVSLRNCCICVSSHCLRNIAISIGLLLSDGISCIHSPKSKLSAIEFSISRCRNSCDNRVLLSHFLGQFLACHLVPGSRECMAAFVYPTRGLCMGQ